MPKKPAKASTSACAAAWGPRSFADAPRAAISTNAFRQPSLIGGRERPQTQKRASVKVLIAAESADLPEARRLPARRLPADVCPPTFARATFARGDVSPHDVCPPTVAHRRWPTRRLPTDACPRDVSPHGTFFALLLRGNIAFWSFG